MTAAYICAWPGGQSAHDTEADAEFAAAEVIKSKRADFAVAYRVEVEGDR